MGSIFKFRVVLDTQDDVFRDVEIGCNQTLEEFYEVILGAFEFRGGQMASFYLSNEKWDKGTEYTLLDMSEGRDGKSVMSAVILNDIMEDDNQKLILVYDFLRMWCFYVELQEELPEVKGITYPRVVMKFGTAPDEESKEIDDAQLFAMDGPVLPEDFDDDDDDNGGGDEIGDMFDELSDFNGDEGSRDEF